MENEVWKPIASYAGYEVSDLGRVRSPRKILKPYPVVYRPTGRIVKMIVSMGRRSQHLSIHHLVLEAFGYPRPPGMEGCHADGDPTNNRLSNLRWDTHAANMADMKIHGSHFTPFGLDRSGEKHHKAKLTDAAVRAIRASPPAPGAVAAMARQYGVSSPTIIRVVEGRSWRHVTC